MNANELADIMRNAAREATDRRQAVVVIEGEPLSVGRYTGPPAVLPYQQWLTYWQQVVDNVRDIPPSRM